MSVAAAIAQLEAWTVSGVTTNLAVDDAQQTYTLSMYPIMTLVLSPSGGEGMDVIDLDLSTGRAVLFLEHDIYLSPIASGDRGAKQRALFAMLDAYLAELVSDPLLSSNLAEPMKVVGAWAGTKRWRGVGHYTLSLRLRLVFEG